MLKLQLLVSALQPLQQPDSPACPVLSDPDFPAPPALQPLQRFHDEVVQHTDAGAAMGNAVVTFDQVHVLAPRGRFEVEMYLSSLKLTGQVRGLQDQAFI